MARHPTRIHKANLNFHERLAVKLAAIAGSPYAIYVSLLVSLSSLPAVLATHSVLNDVYWLSGTCIQLVMLFVLQTKSVIDGKHSEAMAEEMYNNMLAVEQMDEDMHEKLDEIIKKLSTGTPQMG